MRECWAAEVVPAGKARGEVTVFGSDAGAARSFARRYTDQGHELCQGRAEAERKGAKGGALVHLWDLFA